MRSAWAVYLAGVLVGLWRTDGGPAARLMLALLWPLGPLAFAGVVVTLLGAAVIAFPTFGAAVAVALVMAWWLFG